MDCIRHTIRLSLTNSYSISIISGWCYWTTDIYSITRACYRTTNSYSSGTSRWYWIDNIYTTIRIRLNITVNIYTITHACWCYIVSNIYTITSWLYFTFNTNTIEIITNDILSDPYTTTAIVWSNIIYLCCVGSYIISIQFTVDCYTSHLNAIRSCKFCWSSTLNITNI